MSTPIVPATPSPVGTTKVSLSLLIASIVASSLSTIPGIPMAIGVAINSVGAILTVLLKNGVPTTFDPSVILTTLSAAIAALKAQPGLSQSVLNDIQVLDNALQAAFTADAQAVLVIDPTKLQQETPIA